MGNQNSSQRPPGTPASSSSASASVTSESPRTHSRRESKHPIIPPQNHHRGTAAPPEPSSAHAQGSSSTSGRAPPNSNSGRPAPQPQQQYPITDASLPGPGNSRAPVVSDEPSKPVAVPCSAQHAQQQHLAHGQPASSEPGIGGGAGGRAGLGLGAGSLLDTTESGSVIIPTSSVQDMSYLARPPRLPLPIEEEIHTPGSPIISPDDLAGSPVGHIDPLDSEETLGRKSSALSAGALDEDDVEELRVDKNRPTVPFRLEWPGGGDKIYVTGTIFQWNRKHRLHPVEGKPGVFAATINILPGTHHVRFLVDGQMQTSPDLPTTVDFGNNLVNYIEVSAHPAEGDGTTAPQPDPSAAATADQRLQPPSQHGPSRPGGPVSAANSQIDEKTIRYKDVEPIESFEHEIPKYLVDFDQPEDSPQYHVSVGAIEKLPTPPSLPGFLGKPILNAAVLIKDDNSVLNMPNHTVLNHLATSSIKNNILAVSATTRYKSKYVTTIIYKPTSTDG